MGYQAKGTPQMTTDEQARDEWNAIARDWGCFETVEQQAELLVLCRGGVTKADYDFAARSLDRKRRAYPIGDRWGYLRTVMLCHRAERIADQVLAGLGYAEAQP